ncbi:AAA family ATPase [Conexibacter sp. CPCC 206217]|uniref:ATP-binding protein n=1 Tax=Conexibacter sp. CPCC 206217 TaxID=3064574 RepID=UPI0027286CB7|nr:AAA family ATPase [Conexibacter sp. CPCC 206217]MDO8209086.1 AAA family ATPase [Conexibacter sp. CPCC 206217]
MSGAVVREERQRPPAEELHAAELAQLAARDGAAPRPAGWRLTPRSVLAFVRGDAELGVAPKYVGSRAFVERCVVALATDRGLMLVGEPGTAKSLLSELLAAAISGDSTLTIQGSAATTEDAIAYSWNYALLLAEGPSARALVPAPLHRGMSAGAIVRFEEITRCAIEVQDALLGILSERALAIPELDGDARTLFARRGFNVIATANTRDRGVNEMSAALKRRFSFETVLPIADPQAELELVEREADRRLAVADVPLRTAPELTQALVTACRELRAGRTEDGAALEPLSSAMSTAEVVSVCFAACAQAHWFGAGEVTADHVVTQLAATAAKDDPADVLRLRHYLRRATDGHAGDAWHALDAAAEQLAGP